MIDIDRFKKLNDTFGHAVGDHVLREVARAIGQAVREDDVPARFGGEEFAVLLRNPSPEVAVEVGERVRRAVSSLDLRRLGVPGVSVSVGVAVATTPDVSARRRDRRGRPGPLPREARRARPGRRRLADGAALADGRRPYHSGMAPDPADEPPRPSTSTSSTPTTPTCPRPAGARRPTATSPGSSTRSATSSRSRARSSSRPSPTTAPPTRSPGRRSTSRRRTRRATGGRSRASGQAIGDKIVELATTGHMAAHERLRAEIPASLVDLLRIPGVGPKTVRVVYEGLGIETLEDLRQAAEAGRLRGLKGISASTEQRILEGIEQLESRPQRLLLNRAQAISDDLVAQLEGTPGVRRIVQAGSLRRRRETIGDLDLLVETDDPDAVVARFTGPRRRRAGAGRRAREGRGQAAARAAGGPDGHAARRGRHVPRPLHRAPPTTTSALRGHRPRPRLEPVREGLRPDRRGRAGRSRATPPTCGPSPTRPPRTPSSTSPSSSPSCARTGARSRPPARAGCRR